MIGVFYKRLRTQFARPNRNLPRIKSRCFVLGLAPDAVAPDSFDETWSLVTVNASQAALNQIGCNRIPDITVMSGQMLGAKPANVAAQEAIRGLSTRHLVVIERSMSKAEVERRLAELGYSYWAVTHIDHWQR